jgi:signal transduction histidine kinase
MEETTDPLAMHQRALSILYLAMLSGQLILAGLFYFLAPVHVWSISFSDIFTIVLLFISVLLIAMGHVIYQKRIAEAQQKDSLEDKIAIYRQGFIFRLATLEGLSLISIIFSFVTHCFGYYLFLAISLAILASINPTMSRLRQQLGIN